MSSLDKLFYFVFQGLAFFGLVIGILMISAFLAAGSVNGAEAPPWWWHKFRT